MTPETRDEMTDFGPRFAQTLARVDHEIGTAAFLPVAHLRCEDRLEFFARHARPRKNTASLKMRGR